MTSPDPSSPSANGQSYAVIGTGALGGLYGGMLARAGHEVHFLLHSDFDHVRRNGLKVESIWGDFDLPKVHAYATADDLPACDVTILALKTTLNDRVSPMLAAPTRDGGHVLVLQNGLNIESAAIEITSRQRVMSGCCFLCSNKVGPGHIRHLDQGRIVFGGLDPAASREMVERTATEMTAAGIDVKATDDVALVRWRKLMWNIPFNGLSVVLDASTQDLINEDATVALAERLVGEVHAAAAALGVTIPDEHKRQTIDVTRKMVPYDSSMRLDYLAGRPLEIEAIFDHPIEAAQSVGVDMPAVRSVRDQLRFLDRRNRARQSDKGRD